MDKKLIRLLTALLAVIVAGVVFCCSNGSERESKVSFTDTASEVYDQDTARAAREEVKADDIWVYVHGCVAFPGVYSLKEGSRVYEAVEMAGGMTEEAVKDYINLAEKLSDGQQIYVPGKDETGSTFQTPVLYTDDGLIDINRAGLQELMTLPGIGNSRASAIIAYREEREFVSIEDIMNVPGIKENVFNKIKNLIKV